MKKVYIGVGHGGSDSGAVKYLVEKDINLHMAKACRDYLKENGVETYISRETDVYCSLRKKINEAKALKVDFAIDIHNNAGGGDGFEVFHSVLGGKGIDFAKNIEAEVIKIGQNSRGLKTKKASDGRDYFGFIRETICPALIVEGVFVDNEFDCIMADTKAKCEVFGIAYAKGILKTLNVEDKNENKNPNSNGEFKVKTNKGKVTILKSVDIVSSINEVGVYTITEEQNGWGKLKSGLGWICLDNVTRL